jgi:hypothetical protein
MSACRRLRVYVSPFCVVVGGLQEPSSSSQGFGAGSPCEAQSTVVVLRRLVVVLRRLASG